jgi:hypothetical protein
MRKLSGILFAAIMVGIIAGMSFGATYYVSTTGNDNNNGSSGSPWRTLQKAANTMVPGDTTIVLNGTYTGFRRTETGTGTAGHPITMKAQNVRGVTLNAIPTGAKHNGVLELEGGWDTPGVNMAYWVIDGFVVDGTSAHRAIDTRVTDHLTIQNCTAHHSKASSSAVATGIFASWCFNALVQNNISYSNTEHGCYTNNSADNGTVRSNVWYSNTGIGHHMNGDASQGGDGQMTGWLIERNTSYSNTNGYDGDGVSSSTWKNNLGYSNSSKALQMTKVDGTSNPSSDRIVNNTFLAPVGGYYVLNFAAGTGAVGTNNFIENNILFHMDINNTNRGGLDYVSTWMSTLTSDYNLCNRFAVNDSATRYTLAQWQAAYSKDMHSVTNTDINAIFSAPGSNNYHLKAGSPAIDHGATLSDVTNDHDGAARVAPYDIGCYVY